MWDVAFAVGDFRFYPMYRLDFITVSLICGMGSSHDVLYFALTHICG